MTSTGDHELRLIRTLVADDSAFTCELFKVILDSEPDFAVVGTASTGRQCIDLVRELRPDLVTMDIGMPNGDGIAATREIMTIAATPIVVVTARPIGAGSPDAFDAISAGAIDVIAKPDIMNLCDTKQRDTFLRTMRMAASVRVIGFHARTRRRSEPEAGNARGRAPSSWPPVGEAEATVIAIGASTGGPNCVRRILELANPSIAPPILVVQHMGAEFIPGFAKWLGQSISLPVELARHGGTLRPGRVYIAPGDRHLTLGDARTILLNQSAPIHHQRPAVDTLFHSVAQHVGPAAVGIVLTGMGRDGTTGMTAMRAAGAFTMAQDEASCVATGMPVSAARSGAASHICPPEEIAARLAKTRHLPLHPAAADQIRDERK